MGVIGGSKRILTCFEFLMRFTAQFVRDLTKFRRCGTQQFCLRTKLVVANMWGD